MENEMEVLVRAHKAYMEAIEKGCIGVGEDYIQLRGEDFKRIMRDEPLTARWNGLSVDVTGTVEIDGKVVKVITLF